MNLPNQEKKERPDEVVVVACMDEDIDYEPGMLVAGVAGSMVTHLEGGNEAFFPIEKRQRVQDLTPGFYKAMERVSQKLGKRMVGTSHTGCGWLKAQGVTTSEEMAQLTQEALGEHGVKYVGHVDVAEEPIEVNDSGLHMHIGRKESDHHHHATSIALTVGGFITEEEIQRISTEYGDSFIISADWLADAIEQGIMSEEDALFLVALQIDVADGIADGVSKDSSCKIFNAGRLEGELASRNEAFVQKILNSFAAQSVA